MSDLETAEVRFIVAKWSVDDELTIAVAEFDGVKKVGCGPDRREAMHDLFRNATGATTFEYAPGAAWKDINKETP